MPTSRSKLKQPLEEMAGSPFAKISSTISTDSHSSKIPISCKNGSNYIMQLLGLQ